MFTEFTLHCQPFERSLIDTIRELCQLLGIRLKLVFPGNYPEEKGTFTQSANLIHKTHSGQELSPQNRSFTPETRISALSGVTLGALSCGNKIYPSTTIMIAGDEEDTSLSWPGTVLRLPKDSEQFIALLSYANTSNAQTQVIVCQLCAPWPGMEGIFVAGALAKALDLTLADEDRSKLRDINAKDPPLASSKVLIADCSGQGLPLTQLFLGPEIAAESASWQSYCQSSTTSNTNIINSAQINSAQNGPARPGKYFSSTLIPSRLIDTLPSWFGIGLLSHGQVNELLLRPPYEEILTRLSSAYPIQVRIVSLKAALNQDQPVLWALPAHLAALQWWQTLRPVIPSDSRIVTVPVRSGISSRQLRRHPCMEVDFQRDSQGHLQDHLQTSVLNLKGKAGIENMNRQIIPPKKWVKQLIKWLELTRT